MSLVQHVSAVEGVDREPDTADLQLDQVPSHLRGRRPSLTLSYHPLPITSQPVEKAKPAAAFETSPRKRLVQVATGVLSCVFASGIVFGFAALKSVLVGEKVYRDLCTDQELMDNVQICYMQDLRLNLAFTIASVTTNVSALVAGTVLDRYGPRVCGFSGSCFLLLGSLSMAFASLPFENYIAGHFLLALGGTFVFVPSFQLSNAFPRFQGLILALITGAFDASASIFLLFRLVYEASNHAFGLKQCFLVYLVVPVAIFISQLVYMPKESYQTRTALAETAEQAQDPAQDMHDSDDELDTDADIWRVRSQRNDERKRTIAEIQDLLGSQAQWDEHEKKEEEKRFNCGVWGALHGRSAWDQIRSPWFILITLLTTIQMARMNFFIATIWTQYRFLLDSASKAAQVNEFFDAALPIGGIVTVPFIGLLLDDTSTSFVLGLLVFISTVTSILGVIPTLPFAYAKVVLFVLFRPLYYSAMSDYAAKVFGFATFGTVYGTIICISGLTTFVQFPLQALTHDIYHNDPTPVNLGLASVGLLVGLTLVAFVVGRAPAIQQEVANEEERRSLLPRPTPRPSLQNMRSLGVVHE